MEEGRGGTEREEGDKSRERKISRDFHHITKFQQTGKLENWDKSHYQFTGTEITWQNSIPASTQKGKQEEKKKNIQILALSPNPSGQLFNCTLNFFVTQDGSEVKSTYFSSRGLVFHSQNPHVPE